MPSRRMLYVHNTVSPIEYACLLRSKKKKKNTTGDFVTNWKILQSVTSIAPQCLGEYRSIFKMTCCHSPDALCVIQISVWWWYPKQKNIKIYRQLWAASRSGHSCPNPATFKAWGWGWGLAGGAVDAILTSLSVWTDSPWRDKTRSDAYFQCHSVPHSPKGRLKIPMKCNFLRSAQYFFFVHWKITQSRGKLKSGRHNHSKSDRPSCMVYVSSDKQFFVGK